MSLWGAPNLHDKLAKLPLKLAQPHLKLAQPHLKLAQPHLKLAKLPLKLGELQGKFDELQAKFGELRLKLGELDDALREIPLALPGISLMCHNGKRGDRHMAEFPDSPEGWVNRSHHFLEVAQAAGNEGVFDLDAARLTGQADQTATLETLLHQRETLEDQLKGINAQIKVEDGAVQNSTRANLGTASKSQASDDLKAQAGVTIARPTTHSAPIVPTGLVATPNANGTALLKWERSGNIPGAKFVVEKQTGQLWTMVDMVTATQLLVLAPVGQPSAFRVSARNGQGTSLPGETVVIYAT